MVEQLQRQKEDAEAAKGDATLQKTLLLIDTTLLKCYVKVGVAKGCPHGWVWSIRLSLANILGDDKLVV